MRKRLKEAIATGEIIPIVYSGGSQPGTLRYIRPIKVETDRVQAYYYDANGLRVFIFRKMREVDALEAAGLPRYSAPTDHQLLRPNAAVIVWDIAKVLASLALAVCLAWYFWWPLIRKLF